jgi:PAS domain S-box-containing protein
LVAERTNELSRLSTNLSTILSSLVEGIVATDAEGRIQLVNPAGASLLGSSPDEALGQLVHEQIDFSPEQGEAPGQALLRLVLASSRPLSGHLRSSDGTRRLVSIQAAPLKGRDEATTGTVLVLRDIGIEREVADQRLRHQKLESLGLLAGGIAHDFNNILAGILGSISVARLESARGRSADSLLEQAEKACIRAQGLTTQLLTFSRGGTPVRKVIDVVRPVREAAELALVGSPCQLVLTSEADVFPVDADEGQLSQAIGNLVLNAKQAMPAGGQVTIHIDSVTVTSSAQSLLAPGDYVRILVRDHGTGIAPEHRQRIFDPYFTTKPTGSGLGLASVHSIVSQHDGHVEVTSTLGVGAEFALYLPSAAKAAHSEPRNAAKEAARGSKRVLVLDDDDGVRRVMGAMLSLLGHEAVVVAHSSEALEAFSRAGQDRPKFDAVFVDLTMPGDLSGEEVIARLRALDPNARIIVMSGYSSDPVMANYREHGLSARLRKPFTVAQVGELLD